MGRKSRAKRDRQEPTLCLPHTEPVPVSLFEVARVRHFMAEADQGRWRLRHFTRTQEEFDDNIRRYHATSERPQYDIARAVQPGDYVSLQRRMTEHEMFDTFRNQNGMTVERAARECGLTVEEGIERWMPYDLRWIPVMSDTHAEILEHHHPLNHATGRVLITGLGLGCLPHALLTKPDVTRIDIIDIDPDVIALTGHYLTDPRVHIWRGSAAEPQRIAELRSEAWCWDYAWHDIWTHVSNKNLDDETAEHGISYQRLFDHYEPYADQQAAWAYELALSMEADHEQETREELEFRQKIRDAPLDEAVELVYNMILADRIRVGENTNPFKDGRLRVPDEFRDMLDPERKLRAHIHTMLSNPDDPFWTKLDEPVTGPEGLDSPNAHLMTELESE